MPLDAIVLIKLLTADGDVSWASRATDGVTDAESLGALIGETDRRRQDYLRSWVPNDDDD